MSHTCFDEAVNSVNRLALLAFLICLAVPGTTYAQLGGEEDQEEEETTAPATFKVGPRITLGVGDISDFGSLAVGADARYQPAGFPVGGNVAFDFYLGDDNVSVFTLDLNAIYPIETESSFSPYFGAGLGYTSVSFDTGTQFGRVGESEPGLNLVGGAEFEVGQFQPFVQGQFTLQDAMRLGITGGLLLSL